jgi:hypothetical protein
MINATETIAKALEISIALTKADHTYLRMDDRGFVFVKEPPIQHIANRYQTHSIRCRQPHRGHSGFS